MFKINLINITLWILASILVITTLITLLWRIIERKKINKSHKEKQIGSASKHLSDLSLSLNNIYDCNILFNILIKNKFAKSKYSLIPALVEKHGNIFLLTNSISIKGSQKILINKNSTLIMYKNKQKQIENFNLRWYIEINRYLYALNNKIKIYNILPTINQNKKHIKIQGSLQLQIIAVEEVGDYITSFKPNNNNETINLFKKIQNKNLIKTKGRISNAAITKGTI